MNKTSNLSSCLFALALAAALGVACNQSGSENTSQSVNAGTPSSASTPPANNLAPASTKDISGSYTVSGENEGGSGKYTGDLTVTKRGEVYQFSWKSGNNSYDGVGVQGANSVGVAFTEGSDGTGCGVVLYQVQPDGSLNGMAGYWG